MYNYINDLMVLASGEFAEVGEMTSCPRKQYGSFILQAKSFWAQILLLLRQYLAEGFQKVGLEAISSLKV